MQDEVEKQEDEMKNESQGQQKERSRAGQVCPPLPPSLTHTDSVSQAEQQQPENAGLLLRAVEWADEGSPSAAAPAAPPPPTAALNSHTLLSVEFACRERGEQGARGVLTENSSPILSEMGHSPSQPQRGNVQHNSLFYVEGF